MRNDKHYASRRRFLQTLAASGAIAANDLTWWMAPFVSPRKASAASIVRYQFSVPEPKRTAIVESLVERFNKSQSEVEVKVEFVPQAQARQKLITAVAAGNPPDCCQMYDNWLGEFDGMGAVEDLTERARKWKHYADVLPGAWDTVTVKGRTLSLPLDCFNDAIFYRTDRLKEYSLQQTTGPGMTSSRWPRASPSPRRTSMASACGGAARGRSSMQQCSCTGMGPRC